MAFSVVTIRPNSTPQTGSGTLVGAATMHAALADASDASYVQIPVLTRLDSQVPRVGFPAPTIPAGAKVYSVTLRRRIQNVLAGQPRPLCHHWFRTLDGTVVVAGQLQDVLKLPFISNCPSDVAATWVDETVAELPAGPGGKPWDVTTNLAALAYDLGRGDNTASTLRVSAVYVDVAYQQVSAVTATGPTGTISSTRPTVTSTYASPDSQPQQQYRVAVYTAAQVAAPGFTPFVSTPTQASGIQGGTPAESWWVLGEDLQWTLTADLVDGTYTAYVQAAARWDGVGDFTTAISSTTWTRAVATASPPPPVTQPPAAVLNSAVVDSVNNRVALTFQAGGSSPATVAATIEASRDGGTLYQPIPSLTHIPVSGTSPVTVYDYVANLNITSRYRVIAYSGYPLVAAALASNVLTATPQDDRDWFKHPTNPLLSTPFVIAQPSGSEGIKVTKRRMMGTFYPVSGPGQKVLPFIIYGPSSGDEFELELLFNHGEPSMDYWAAVDQLDRSDATVLWQRPDGTNLWVALGPGGSGRDTEETYRPIPGNVRVVQQRRRKITATETRTPDFY